MKKWIRMAWVAGTGLMLTGGAMASDIVISKDSGKTAVDVSGLAAGTDGASREFVTVVRNGLNRSGWLMVGSPQASGYAVTGTVQFDGSAMRVNLRVGRKAANQIILTKSYNAAANGVRGIAHQAADDILLAITGSRGFNSSRLVMVGNRTGHKELYMADSDGFRLHPLTADKTISMAPRWGNTADTIIYTSYLRRFPALYKIDMNTRSRTRIANYAGLNTGGVVSPDGRDMALILSKDGNPELYVMRLSDGRLTRLTQTTRASEASPAWSPDGRQLVYVSDQSGAPQLYVIGREGGQPRQLTTRGRQNVAPDWGPGGLIAYASLVGSRFQIFVIHPGTGQIEQITSDPSADHEDPSWAPNGRHMACVRTVGRKSNVYLIDRLGDSPLLLTSYEGDWFSPRWSP